MTGDHACRLQGTMSLLEWLGRSQIRALSPLLKRPTEPDRLVLGVLGTRSNIQFEEFIHTMISPVVEAWGQPDEIILPDEGDSNLVIQEWASKQGIPVSLVSCDWAKQGRRAAPLRDSMIQRRSTHLLLLQGPRSNTLSSLARRLHRKGVPVVISERPGEAVKSVDPE